MNNIREWVKVFDKIYDMLYECEENNSQLQMRADELAEQFDEKMADDDDFKEAVKDFDTYRADFVTSDREAAAFMIMYEFCM